MVNICGRNIKITRGDSAYIKLEIKIKNRDDYVLTENDRVFFTLKKDLLKKEYIFQKELSANNYDDDSLYIYIEPKDTYNLDFGNYFYDVQLNVDNKDVYTIIPTSIFEVLPEVTSHLDDLGV